MKKIFTAIPLSLALVFIPAMSRGAVDRTQLEAAVAAAQNAFLEQPTGETGTLIVGDTNTLYTSLQIMLYYYLNRQEAYRDNIDSLRQYLLHAQSADGSWPLYDSGPASHGLSVLNYFALKLSGFTVEDPALQRAGQFIRNHGGADAADGWYKSLLALFDQFDLPEIPRIPPQLYVAVAPQLSWVRMLILPLAVVLQEKAVCIPPAAAYIDELFLDRAKSRRIPPDSEAVQALRTAVAAAGCPTAADTGRLSCPLGYRRVIHWLLARQNASDGLFYDYMPTTFCALLALKALEDIDDSAAAIDRALAGLRAMQIPKAEGVYQPPSDDTVPSTCSAVVALVSSGLTLDNPALRGKVDFLWSRQHCKFGDWFLQLEYPVLPGGWGFTYSSESFPDIDDTASAVMILKTAYGDNWHERWWDFNRALMWLLAMQNRDGGWGTWDRASLLTEPMKTASPSVVFNESVVDHTTRVLNALSCFGFTEKNSLRVARAVRWVKAQRLEDGSWEGTWFVDYVYQTAHVLGALALVKADMSAAEVEESLDFILEKQNDDGGWGESAESFSAKEYVPLGYSSPSQTGFILYGLLHFLRGCDFQYIERLRAPLNRAVNYLLSAQTADGYWHDPIFLGVVFANIQYVRYPLVQESAILTALGMYLQDVDMFSEMQAGTLRRQ